MRSARRRRSRDPARSLNRATRRRIFAQQPLRRVPGKDDELPAQGRVLGLAPLARLEERGNDVEQEADGPDRRIAGLAWTAGSARPIRSSVATA